MTTGGFDSGFSPGFDGGSTSSVVVPGGVGGGSGSAYTITVRDRTTLEVLGELAEFVELSYERRGVEAGSFTLTIHNDSPPPSALGGEPDRSLLDEGRLLEVRRRGVFEFAGVIDEGRELDAVTRIWTLSGPDLLGYFLRRRVVAVEEEDAVVATAAETALKHFVDFNGGPSTVDVDRRFSEELDGLTWTVEATAGAGELVDFAALRRNLLADVLVPIARAGDVLHRVVYDDAGYQYQVYEPTPASSVPFAVSWVNVSSMTYRENLADVRNAVYVLGPGTGDTRTVQEVVDSASIAARGRHEMFLDSRDASTTDAQTQLGLLEIASREAARVGADAQPHLVNSVYRVDYDLGQDVTLSIPEAGVVGITKRITAVKVTVGVEETIEVELGAPPRTIAGIIADNVRRTLRAQFA